MQTCDTTKKLCSERGKSTPAVPGAGGLCYSPASAVCLTAATTMGLRPGLCQGASLLAS